MLAGQDPARETTVRASAHPQGPTRKLKADENDIFNGMRTAPFIRLRYSLVTLERQEVRNERALFVYNRVQHKLTGMHASRICEPAA